MKPDILIKHSHVLVVSSLVLQKVHVVILFCKEISSIQFALTMNSMLIKISLPLLCGFPPSKPMSQPGFFDRCFWMACRQFNMAKHLIFLSLQNPHLTFFVKLITSSLSPRLATQESSLTHLLFISGSIQSLPPFHLQHL